MSMQYNYEDFKARWPKMFENVYCGFHLPVGWGPIVWRLCQGLENISDAENPVPSVAQVKEKFGGLRFYVNGESNRHEKMISATEYASFLVCEECSTTKDVTTEGGWLKTLCKRCRKKAVRRRKFNDLKWEVKRRTPWYAFRLWRLKKAREKKLRER